MLFIELYSIGISILLSSFFLLYSNLETFKFINHQHKQKRHAARVEFLQTYNFTIEHKFDVQNVVADALSRKHALL